jgi:hypothetical protein
MTQSLTTEPPALWEAVAPAALPGDVTPDHACASGDGAAWAGPHRVNIRLSLPTPWGRVYLLALAGRERRGADRRRWERERHPLATLGNLVVMLLLGGLVGLAGLAAMQIASAFLLGDPGPAP